MTGVNWSASDFFNSTTRCNRNKHLSSHLLHVLPLLGYFCFLLVPLQQIDGEKQSLGSIRLRLMARNGASKATSALAFVGDSPWAGEACDVRGLPNPLCFPPDSPFRVRDRRSAPLFSALLRIGPVAYYPLQYPQSSLLDPRI